MMKLAVLLVVGLIAGQTYGDEPEAIVGGNPATKGQFPHQVSVQMSGSHTCGGTIISDIHVLTAGHCISEDKNKWGRMTVVTGATNLINSGERHSIRCIQVHEGWGDPNSYMNNNDIAVITLAQPIKSSNLQRPISLASKDYGTANHNVLLSGWGMLGAWANVPNILQWISLKIMNLFDCMKIHRGLVTGNQTCTYVGHGKGACMGDSGGPLICNNELIGVVSWGSPCAVGVPDVFTNVFKYRDWIKGCVAKSPNPNQCPMHARVY